MLQVANGSLCFVSSARGLGRDSVPVGCAPVAPLRVFTVIGPTKGNAATASATAPFIIINVVKTWFS